MSREQCPESITYQDIVVAIKVLRCYVERVEEVKRLLKRAGLAELLHGREVERDFMTWLLRESIRSATLQQAQAQEVTTQGFTEEEVKRIKELAKKYTEQKA